MKMPPASAGGSYFVSDLAPCQLFFDLHGAGLWVVLKADGRDVAEKLKALELAARGQDNLMPPLLEAVKSYATLGEMMDALRNVFGEYQPSWGY